MDAERWQRLSPLLDALFELEPDARAQRLQRLRDEDPALADDLESLIALEEERSDFLTEPLVAPLAGARAGAEIGPYRLDRMLGEGGMGQVWLAARADGLYQRRVALKLLRPGFADTNLRLRFTRERQILARLAHPHIARLLDAGISQDGLPYLALEYVEGEPITDYCRSHATPLLKRLHMFHQVCDAVSHAHANLIVHRDLKPSNILVTPVGEVRLLDFGIAKLLDSDVPVLEQTRTGVRAFTLHYAAPEQIRGEPVTTMTDVYSLGVVLYELLTDGTPYRLKRKTDAEWEEAILVADPWRPSQALLRRAEGETESGDDHDAHALRRRARALAGDLDNIVLKTLSKRPEQRYPSVEALALDLQRYEAGRPVQARPQSLGYRANKYLHRHHWALATAGLVTLVLGAALTIVAWQARQAVAEASRAQAMQDFMVGLFERAGDAPQGQALDLRALLDTAEASGSRQLAREPRARAELLGVLARMRTGLGDYRQAQALLDRQATLIDHTDGIPVSLRLESLTQRGQLLRLLGQVQPCIDLMEPALDQARGEQAQLPLQAAQFYSQLGRCRSANGDRQSARLHFERALALRRDPLDDKVGVIENLIDLAALHADANDNAAAMRGYQGALAQLRQSVGERHPLAIDLQHRIGLLHRALGNAVQAERAFAEALTLAGDLLGPEHPTTLGLRRLRAGVQFELGQFDEAEHELRPTLAVLIERLGNKHVDVGSSFHILGMVAWERGELDAAVRDLARAVTIWREPSGQSLLPRGLADYGHVLNAAGRGREALAALEESRRLWVAQLGAEHPRIGDLDRVIGETLAAQGRHDDAIAQLTQAVRITRAAGADQIRARRAELALAREQARDGDANALARLDAIAALPAANADARKVSWQARAYAAEVRCRNAQRDTGRAALDALQTELATALPQGGVLPREVAAMRAKCD